MKTINTTNARQNLYMLINETCGAHEPIRITGKKNNAILISEDDLRAVQETLYLISNPGMRESIKKGFGTSVSECSEELDW
jgi:PHD/YefM family antitoxin component YafN of YafNO toxin-antitoxin module